MSTYSLHFPIRVPDDVLVELGEFTGTFWSDSLAQEPFAIEAIRNDIKPACRPAAAAGGHLVAVRIPQFIGRDRQHRAGDLVVRRAGAGNDGMMRLAAGGDHGRIGYRHRRQAIARQAVLPAGQSAAKRRHPHFRLLQRAVGEQLFSCIGRA